jgi:DNA-directed RNA polymerase specialized sigma24 family protein
MTDDVKNILFNTIDQPPMTKLNTKICSDVALCTLIRKNRQLGFEKLYKTYGCILYGLALQSVSSKDLAEEIVQQTFVNVLKKIDHFSDQKYSFQVWMIQNLIITIKEFLSEKHIDYNFTLQNFPEFKFELKQQIPTYPSQTEINSF